MIVLKACVLYIISGVGGFATPTCYVDGTNMLMVSSPDYIYQVSEVPSEVMAYRVEDPVVEYWTEPTIRVTFGTYFSYVRHRPHYRRRIIRRQSPRPRIRPRAPVRSAPRVLRPHHPHRRATTPRSTQRRSVKLPVRRSGRRVATRPGVKRRVATRPSVKRRARPSQSKRGMSRNRNVRRNRRN